MNVALRRPMSREEFLDWAGRREEWWEFDGFQPVAMTGGSPRHDRLTFRLQRELDRLLSGRACRSFGPNAGIATVGSAVRYPDALVTCSPIQDDLARIVPDPVVVFEVISPTSIHTDRVTKLQEYGAVASVRRYVIIESDVRVLTVFYRDAGDGMFQAFGLGGESVLSLPEIGIEIPVAALYDGILAPAAEEER